MRSVWRRRIASALLAASIVVAALPGIGRAADGPDLKVDHVGLFVGKDGQVNDRVVTFKVTNVGDRDAEEGSGKLEILSPPPKREEPLKFDKVIPKKGGSYEGFLQLPASCDGHEVRVSVRAPGETNLGNNTAGPLKLCPEKPKPAPKPGSGPVQETEVDANVLRQSGPETKIDTDLVLIPEHMRPGEHELELEPSATATAFRQIRGSGVLGAPEPTGLAVGWSQWEAAINGPLSGDVVHVAQTAVTFDLSKLNEVPRKEIVRATLSYDEVAERWTDGEGRLRIVSGCVAVLGVATVDWADQPVRGLFPNATIADVTPRSTRAWDVTPHFQDYLARFGYVLRGSLEELEADDDTSCMSIVSNIRLRITYRVPG